MKRLILHPYGYPILLGSAALGAALISQYGFGAHPCDLCILQRYPYLMVIVASAIGWLIAPKYQTFIRIGIVIGFLTTLAIAAYHSAVEQGWVKGPSGCTVSLDKVSSLESLKQQILGSPLVSCGEISVSFAGLSMASWNALYALFAAVTCLIIWKSVHVKGSAL